MKRLLVDLDDVLALNAYLNMMNDYLGTNYTYEDINDYYVEKILTKEQLIKYRNYFKTYSVYDYAEIAPYSREVLMDLMLTHEIYICSSYHSELDNTIMPELIPKKCEFLMKNYPFLSSKNFIFANDKSMIDADIRIDDNLNNLTSGIKMLYTAYHNKDISDIELKDKNIIRVNNWIDIKNKLLVKR